MVKTYNRIDFTARKTKINPPKISKYSDLTFLPKLPVQNPIKDIINDTRPIIKQVIIIGVLVNFIVAPATKASILVAIPKVIIHFKPKKLNLQK